MNVINGRVAGALYLVIIVFGIAAELIRSSVLVSGDAAATAENVRDSEWLLRAAFSATLAYTLCEVVLTVILYLLFRPVSQPLSMIAAAFRLISLAIYGLNQLNMLAPLLLADAGQPQTLALLFLDLHQYGYAIGLTFFAANCFAMSYLLVKSSHVPTALGILLGVAGVGYLVHSYAYFLVPGHLGSAMLILFAPAVVAETWFCLLLLRKGGGVQAWEEPVGRRAKAGLV